MIYIAKAQIESPPEDFSKIIFTTVDNIDVRADGADKFLIPKYDDWMQIPISVAAYHVLGFCWEATVNKHIVEEKVVFPTVEANIEHFFQIWFASQVSASGQNVTSSLS